MIAQFCNFLILIVMVVGDISEIFLDDEEVNACTQFINESKLLEMEPKTRSRICFLLLNHQNATSDQQEISRLKPAPFEVWGYGLLMVTLISLTSVVGVGVMPLMSRTFYSNLLTCLVGLAVGSLAGSAVFHLIPQAFRLADVDLYPHHSYLNISLSIWAGLYVFFIIERCLKIIMDAKARRQGDIIQGHGHNHNNHHEFFEEKSNLMAAVTPTSLVSNGASVDIKQDLSDHTVEEDGSVGTCAGMLEDTNQLYNSSGTAIRASFGHQERPHPVTRPTVEGVRSLNTKSSNKIATVAWMIIFGDGIHNFIDGLSIGAAFSESILTGLSVSLAVLCEEFPHELGDFAVLLSSGMSVRQAMMYNFLSACTCYLGLILGILLGELDGSNVYIFALAGGMFLYISLVDMVPELNASVEEASRISVKKALTTFCLQNIGIVVGVACLYTLARYQDDITISL